MSTKINTTTHNPVMGTLKNLRCSIKCCSNPYGCFFDVQCHLKMIMWICGNDISYVMSVTTNSVPSVFTLSRKFFSSFCV